MKKIIIAIALLGLVSCGGGTNNDQGTSVTLVGYVADCADTSVFLGGIQVPLSTDTEGEGTVGNIRASMLVHNNLSTQFIRLDRVFMDYYIPGASVQPPSTSYAKGFVIQQAGVSEDGATSPSEGCISANLIPAEVAQWLVLNRNLLPEPPFTLEITSYVTGISQAGDRFDTNISAISATITPDVIITPEGEGEGEAAAGDIEGSDAGAIDQSDIDESGEGTVVDGGDDGESQL